MKFNQLFKEISPNEICDNMFTMVENDFFVVTAGKKEHYNSMIGSGGGFGTLFKKPTTWCIFKADRYTLEIIEKEHTYTLSYFSDEYKKEALLLGNESGKYSDKMKKTKLRSIEMPDKDISFQEAKLIIQCKLTQITTPNPKDFYAYEAKKYIEEAYKDSTNYRKFVFGEITHVWIKNN